MTDTGDKYTIDLDKVVEHVKATGRYAYVEQTGGNVATIYAGSTYFDSEGNERWAAVAGPGWFEGPNWTKGRATLFDFVVGPDDDGESECTTPANIGALDEEAVARLIVAQTTHFDRGGDLSFDEVETLGFDGTCRSRPADMIAEDFRTQAYVKAANAENLRQIDAGVTSVMERIPNNEAAGKRALEAYDAQLRGEEPPQQGDGIVRQAPADAGAALELNGVRVNIYPSEVDPGTVSVQIDTDQAPGQKIRVMLNDADLFAGDPEHDDHPWARQVQAYYDNQHREEAGFES